MSHRPQHLFGGLLILVVLCSTTPGQMLERSFLFSSGTPEHVVGIVCHDNGLIYAITKENTLITYDPATGAVIAMLHPVIETLKDWHLHGMTRAGQDSFWTFDMLSFQLIRARYANGTVIDMIPGPAPMPYGMAYEYGYLWVGHHSEGPPRPIHAVDPDTGSVMAQFDPGVYDTHFLRWINGQLWALDNSSNELRQFGMSGQLRTALDLPPDNWDAMDWNGESFIGVASGAFYLIHTPVLTQDPLVGGSQATFDVDFAPAGSMVYYMVSVDGVGAGPCFPLLGGLCSDLLGHVAIFDQAPVDGMLGSASLTLTLPPLPPGLAVWTQAVSLHPSSGALKSNVVQALTL